MYQTEVKRCDWPYSQWICEGKLIATRFEVIDVIYYLVRLISAYQRFIPPRFLWFCGRVLHVADNLQYIINQHCTNHLQLSSTRLPKNILEFISEL